MRSTMAAAAGSSSSRPRRRCPSPSCACGSLATPTPTSTPSAIDGRSTGRGSCRCSFWASPPASSRLSMEGGPTQSKPWTETPGHGSSHKISGLPLPLSNLMMVLMYIMRKPRTIRGLHAIDPDEDDNDKCQHYALPVEGKDHRFDPPGRRCSNPTGRHGRFLNIFCKAWIARRWYHLQWRNDRSRAFNH